VSRVGSRTKEVAVATTLHRAPHIARRDITTDASRNTARKILLACGVLYGVVYVVASDVIAAPLNGGYNRMDQAISELSGTSAPTRWFLTAMLAIYTALMIAFGIGVRRAARGTRSLHATGTLLVVWGAMGLLWLPFPMTSREDIVDGPMSVNDIGHLVLSGLTFVAIASTLWFGAKSFGRGFRIYSLVTAVTFFVSAALMGTQSPNVPDPTPWMGLYERIMLGAWLQWIAVLAIILLRRRPGSPSIQRS